MAPQERGHNAVTGDRDSVRKAGSLEAPRQCEDEYIDDVLRFKKFQNK